MTPTETARQVERDALLAQITDALRDDSRIAAAWLFGSLGRGVGDALSDIDMCVVVDDAALSNVLADLPAFVAQIAPPLLTRDEPYNAPRGGGYLTVIFDGNTGAHPTDWYFQRQSDARIPPQTRFLFDKIGLTTGDPPTFGNPGVSREGVAVAVQGLNFGWMMTAICAKYVARSPDEPEMGLLPYALHGLNEASSFLGESPVTAADFAPHPTPEAKLSALRRVASLLSEAQNALAERGGAVSPGIADATTRFLDTVAAILRERQASE